MAASTERYRSPKRLKANMSEAVETYAQKDDEHNLNRGRMRVIKDPSLIPSGDSPGHFACLAISEPRGKERGVQYFPFRGIRSRSCCHPVDS